MTHNPSTASDFWSAAMENDAETIKRLFAEGRVMASAGKSPPDAFNRKAWAPPAFASSLGLGVSLATNPLHSACAWGSAQALRALISQATPEDLRSGGLALQTPSEPFWLSPLGVAALCQSVECVEVMLNAQPLLDASGDATQCDPCSAAAFGGNLGCFLAILPHAPRLAPNTDANRFNSWWLAAAAGPNFDIFQAAISRAQTEGLQALAAQAPQAWALACDAFGAKGMRSMLDAFGAPPSEPFEGIPLLARTAANGDIETARILLPWLDPDETIQSRRRPWSQADGAAPLAVAAAGPKNSLKIIELLLAAGADLNATDSLGRTPLMAALSHGGVREGHPPSPANLLALLDAGASISSQDHGGQTCLHRAMLLPEKIISASVLDDFASAIEQLFSRAGQNGLASTRDHHGFSPLDLASLMAAREEPLHRDWGRRMLRLAARLEAHDIESAILPAPHSPARPRSF